MTHFSVYQDVLDYLYTQLPMFQRVGGSAFKKDLSNTKTLCEYLNHPQNRFKSIHIAGTNGKGSSSHMIASILQEAGYKTGLYTSPHLKDFTERIRINGKQVDQQFVIDFVNRIIPVIDQIHPSFFEITVAMAFDYFAEEQVDIAVIEVGMGGRFDSTNVIQPEVSLITNISDDHKQWLGDTLEKIAFEKAGIIKPYTPVVISERQPSITHVFDKKATESGSAIFYASLEYSVSSHDYSWSIYRNGDHFLDVKPGLTGEYQKFNLPGLLKSIELMAERGFHIDKIHIVDGLTKVVANTGLKGRWQVLSKKPFIVCDVGHNIEGVKTILRQIKRHPHNKLHMIWGMVDDKESEEILSLLPKEAVYYFTQAAIPRAKKATLLQKEAQFHGLHGTVFDDVNLALQEVKAVAHESDLVFIGGSNFVVAEIEDL